MSTDFNLLILSIIELFSIFFNLILFELNLSANFDKINYYKKAESMYQRDAVLNKSKTFTIWTTSSHNFLAFSTFVIIIILNMQIFINLFSFIIFFIHNPKKE